MVEIGSGDLLEMLKISEAIGSWKALNWISFELALGNRKIEEKNESRGHL